MKQWIEKQRNYFHTDETKVYAFRKKQLQKLQKMLHDHEQAIYDALKKDLNKSEHEALTTELGILYSEITFTLKHLKTWMKDKQVSTPVTHKGTKNLIMYEPYGVTLIIAPWNYPLQLALAPVIGALAAGNTVIVKPSELAPHTANMLKEMIENTFPDTLIKVIVGDQTVSENLLQERFDYIFFTGSTNVGKIVMEKASRHLTPVTLELGGKSPAIIDKEANIALSAKRLVWGKFTNAGQTCVAPDFVYVHQKVVKRFIKHVKKEIKLLYGKEPLDNEDYVRIINEAHFDRLIRLLEAGTIAIGGQYDRQTLKIAPTVLENIGWDDPVMQSEIFGPLLPVLPFQELDHVIQALKQQEKPLALYYFGSSAKKEANILNSLSFGGGCINDTLYHLANPHLPFGGVGHSGMGAYHGAYSFETFSHRKSILKQTTLFDLPVRYPGSKLHAALAKKLLK